MSGNYTLYWDVLKYDTFVSDSRKSFLDLTNMENIQNSYAS